MRTVIQRVSRAAVVIGGQTTRAIQHGLLVLVGFESADRPEDIDWLCGKIARLRIFNDEQGLMNRSVLEVNGEILVVSQFTLFASTRKGNRPSYSRAAAPQTAQPMYQSFVRQLSEAIGQPVATGEFGADMEITLTNAGPVTIMIDTKDRE